MNRMWVLRWAGVLALAGCGAPADGRYVGRLVGDPPAPCPNSQAVMLVRGDEVRFLPDDGVAVLDGKLSPDGTLAAAAQFEGARGSGDRTGNKAPPRTPFRMVFQGRLDGTRITGTYGTPRCRAHVEMAPG